MLSRALNRLPRTNLTVGARSLSTGVDDPIDENAASALSKSCYQNIDWQIKTGSSVSEAVKRMAAGRIGCLGVTDGDGQQVVGVLSERDYINKIALLERDPTDVKVEEVCTYGVANLVKVRLSDNIDKCMSKMLGRDIRHLLVMEDEKDGDRIVGMISMKDVVKCTLAKANAKVDRLEVIVQTQDMMRHQI